MKGWKKFTKNVNNSIDKATKDMHKGFDKTTKELDKKVSKIILDDGAKVSGAFSSIPEKRKDTENQLKDNKVAQEGKDLVDLLVTTLNLNEEKNEEQEVELTSEDKKEKVKNIVEETKVITEEKVELVNNETKKLREKTKEGLTSAVWKYLAGHQENAQDITKILFTEHKGTQDLGHDLCALKDEGLTGAVINYFTDAE